MLHVQILQARNIPAMDKNGKSDPYCLVSFGDKRTYKTKTVKETLTPNWNEIATFDAKKSDILNVEIWDWDAVGRDDFIGKFVFPLVSLTTDKVLTEWFNLYDNSRKESGQVKLSLLYVDTVVPEAKRKDFDFLTERVRLLSGEARPRSASNSGPAGTGALTSAPPLVHAPSSAPPLPQVTSSPRPPPLPASHAHLVHATSSSAIPTSTTSSTTSTTTDAAVTPVVAVPLPVATGAELPVLERGALYEVDTKEHASMKVMLRWNSQSESDRKGVNLDASCIVLDSKGAYIDSCYFANKKCLNGLLGHSGDREGKSSDEWLLMALSEVPTSVHVLFVIVHSYSGHSVSSLTTTGEVQLLSASTDAPICTFPFPLSGVGFLVLRIYRHAKDSHKWLLNPIGDAIPRLRCIADVIPTVQKNCLDIIPGISITPSATLRIARGEQIKLDEKIKELRIALRWDFVEKSMDLDASVVAYDVKGVSLGKAYFGSPAALDGSIIHGGDNVLGDEDGEDCENITLNLGSMDARVHTIAICVTSFGGMLFSMVKNADIRLIHEKTELLSYSLSDLGAFTAYIMLFIIREKSGWNVRAIGLPGFGADVHELETIMSYLAIQDLSSSEAIAAMQKFAGSH